MSPKKTDRNFRHDCDSCRYLGSGSVPALGHDSGNPEQIYDFYVCETRDDRSVIARFGDQDDEYVSSPLLGCADFTTLDLVALFNGLELRPDEQKRLLQRLAEMYRRGLSVRDYEKIALRLETPFGRGNVLFPF